MSENNVLKYNRFVNIAVLTTCLLICFIGLSAKAESNDLSFYTLSTGDEQIRRAFSIIKTSDGFIWYVTEDGVSRFDGKYTKNYSIPIKWRGILKTNNKEDLFLATSDGIGYQYNPINDRFDLIFIISKSKKILARLNDVSNIPTAFGQGSPSYINSMSIDDKDRIWLGTYNGPVCFLPDKKEWIYLNKKEFKNPFLYTVKNKLYVLTNEEIYIINTSSLYKNIKVVKNSATNSEITSVEYEPSTDCLYVGTANKGLFCLYPDHSFKNVLPLSNSVIRSLAVYDQNTLLVGFDGLGIYAFDIYKQKATNHFLVNENKLNSIGSNAVYEILVDSDNRIWVANYTTGVEIHDPSDVDFIKVKHQLNERNSLCHSNVLSIEEDKNKNMWYGTYNGLSVQNSQTGSWNHFLENNLQTQTNSYINTLCTDKKGDVWFGGASGLFKIATSGNYKLNEIKFQNKINNPENKDILSVFSDGDYIWAAGLHTDLLKINPENTSIENYSPTGVRCIDSEDDNHLFLLTDEQLLSFNKVSGRVDNAIDIDIKNQTKIQDLQYISLRQKNNNIWLATKFGGLIQYSKSTKRCYLYNKENGLPSNQILSIEIDNSDCVWIATDKGLCFLNPITKIIIPFKVFAGSEKGIFNLNASFVTQNGEIVFGSKDGAVVFDPKKMFISPNRAPLAFTNFSILNNNSSKTIECLSEIPLNKSEEITLSYNQNSFTVNFEELIYGHTILPRYTYKLNGFEANFSSLSTDGKATFYSVPPGKYQLEIRSYFADKEGKYISRLLDIRIKQPWYNTFFAWLLWISLTLTIIISVYRYFRHRLEVRYSNEKISFFINVSHDMRTPITLIKAPLIDLLQDTSLAATQRYLVQMISNNVDKLFDMINRVLDFEKTDKHQMKLNVEEFELNEYLKSVIDNFYTYAESNKIQLLLEEALSPLWVVFDKEKMDMIIENLLSNAIKYSKEDGFVKLRAYNNDKLWGVEVIDNGIGIPERDKKLIFKRFYRAENAINSKKIGSGMGLLLVYNLSKLMGGKVLFESEEGLKTVFRLEFPHSSIIPKLQKQDTDITTKASDKTELNESDLPVLLFVDDNNEIRDYLAERLANNYDVICAESAAKAWSVLSGRKVDIVITDIMMPQVSGIELCEKIKASDSFAHIPVILLSALGDKNDIIKGLQIGADDYVTKPFDPTILIQRLDNILRNRSKLTKLIAGQNTENTTIENQPFLSEIDKLFIEKVDKLFESNISNSEYTIEHLSRDMGMSRSVLYNKLKNLTDLSPNDYLRIIRLNKAAELLKSQASFTVYEVAEKVGYQDVKYFSTLFKKNFGVYPSHYQKKK